MGRDVKRVANGCDHPFPQSVSFVRVQDVRSDVVSDVCKNEDDKMMERKDDHERRFFIG